MEHNLDRLPFSNPYIVYSILPQKSYLVSHIDFGNDSHRNVLYFPNSSEYPYFQKHNKNFILQWKDLNDLPFPLILKIPFQSHIGDIPIQTIPSIYIYQFPYLMHFFEIFCFVIIIFCHGLRAMKLFVNYNSTRFC